MNQDNLRLFDRLTDMSDDLIEESQISPTLAAGKPRRKSEQRTTFLDTPWAAAIISGIVAIGVLIGIVTAGQRDIPPAGTLPETASPTEPKTEAESLPDESFAPFSIGMPVDELEVILNRDYPDCDVFRDHILLQQEDHTYLALRVGSSADGMPVVQDLFRYTDRTPTESDGDRILKGMSLQEVLDILGHPDEWITETSVGYYITDHSGYLVEFATDCTVVSITKVTD